MDDLVIQRPLNTRVQAAQLVMLFHGVGSSAEDLRPLGESLALQHPHAWVVSVRSPDASDLGRGWQWFSVRGITEDNRPGRITATMERFVEKVAEWQHAAGAGPESTTLVGFSQGAIMALESTQLNQPPARCVAAIAGRFGQPPRVVPRDTRVHLLHGERDNVVPASESVEAQSRLEALHADVTLDLFPNLGHGIDARVVQRLHERLATP